MSRTSTLLLAALCSADALSIGSAPTITSRAAGPSRPRAMVPESVLTSRAPAARSCGATRAAALTGARASLRAPLLLLLLRRRRRRRSPPHAPSPLFQSRWVTSPQTFRRK